MLTVESLKKILDTKIDELQVLKDSYTLLTPIAEQSQNFECLDNLFDSIQILEQDIFWVEGDISDLQEFGKVHSDRQAAYSHPTTSPNRFIKSSFALSLLWVGKFYRCITDSYQIGSDRGISSYQCFFNAYKALKGLQNSNAESLYRFMPNTHKYLMRTS